MGQNIANQMGLKSCVIGEGDCDPKEADVICFNGFCSVHQLFSLQDIEFYRHKYPDIKRPYVDKVRELKKIYDKCIVNKFSEIDKGYSCLNPYKLKFVADSRNLENNIFIYHLWEVVEK